MRKERRGKGRAWKRGEGREEVGKREGPGRGYI